MKLTTTQLTKRYKNTVVVDKVNLHVPKNKIYGLLGPNGAGKSTILKMISGIIKPSSGQITIDGEKWARQHLSQIGALIEHPPFYPNLTAYENLKVYALLLKVPDTRIDEVLRIVGLMSTGRKLAGKFSLGMKQRLGIAIALLNNPSLLILDEPTNGLDPLGIQELRELIRSFPDRDITVILSSHYLGEVEQVADVIGIIHNGKLRYEAEVSESENLEELFMKVVSKE